MRPVADFLSESWERYKTRLWILVLITGLSGAAAMLAGVVPMLIVFIFARYSMAAWAVGVLSGLCGFLWFASWGQVAAIEAVLSSEVPDLDESFRRAWPKIVPFSWICILWLIFSAGGAFFFMIPGIYLAVGLSFAPFLSVAESRGDFGLLTDSLALIRGRWWSVLGRLLLAGLLSGLPSTIPWIGPILGLIAGPFYLIAAVLVFDDAKRTALLRDSDADRKSKIWLAVAGLAWIIPIVLALQSLAFWRGHGPEFKAQLQTAIFKSYLRSMP